MAKSSNSMYQRLGGFSFPLTSADLSESSFPDPARDTMLALFASAINDELGDAWSTAVTGTPLAGTTPVKETLPMAPSRSVLTQWKPGFPLLALHRLGECTYDELSLQKEQRTQQWQLHHILSPLSVEDVYRLENALLYSVSAVQLVIRLQGHKSYQSGAVQFGSGNGTLANVKLLSHEGPGPASFADDDEAAQYLAITMTLETVEVDSFVDDAFPALEGITLDVGVGDANNIKHGLIVASSNSPLQYG